VFWSLQLRVDTTVDCGSSPRHAAGMLDDRMNGVDDRILLGLDGVPPLPAWAAPLATVSVSAMARAETMLVRVVIIVSEVRLRAPIALSCRDLNRGPSAAM